MVTKWANSLTSQHGGVPRSRWRWRLNPAELGADERIRPLPAWPVWCEQLRHGSDLGFAAASARTRSLSARHAAPPLPLSSGARSVRDRGITTPCRIIPPPCTDPPHPAPQPGHFPATRAGWRRQHAGSPDQARRTPASLRGNARSRRPADDTSTRPPGQARIVATRRPVGSLPNRQHRAPP